MKKAEIIDEFYRLADILESQGDVGILIDMIPYEQQKSFVKSWHDNDDCDQ